MTDTKVTKLGRMPEGALDDYYVREFLENPGNKSKAYERAYTRYCEDCEKSGTEPYGVNLDYARQYAQSIHERLRERITADLYRLADDDKALGASVLRDLAQNADSESVKAQCAANLAKGLYPDVHITKQETYEDIVRELEQIEKELQQGVH